MGKIILDNILDSLSEDERSSVALYILGGYSDREAGIIMNKHEKLCQALPFEGSER